MTGVVDIAGAVQERYNYDPYGILSVLTPYFAPAQSSFLSWETGYAGYRWERESQLYQARNRVYHSYAGWLQRDPLGHTVGMNLYEYVHSRPTLFTDPSGNVAIVLAGVGIAAILEALLIALLIAAVITDVIQAINCMITWYRKFEQQQFANMYPGSDKMRHCVIACQVAKECSMYVSALMVVGKELKDFIKGRASVGDMLANMAGWACGGLVLTTVPIFRHLVRAIPLSCDKCCNYFYCPDVRGPDFFEIGLQDVRAWFRF